MNPMNPIADNSESSLKVLNRLFADCERVDRRPVAQAQALVLIAETLAGIHDTLIRLEATVRMIGVDLQAR